MKNYEPDIASKIDRQRLAAYERLQAINADLLAALEALQTAVAAFESDMSDGNPYFCPSPTQGKALQKVFDDSMVVALRAKGVKE